MKIRSTCICRKHTFGYTRVNTIRRSLVHVEASQGEGVVHRIDNTARWMDVLNRTATKGRRKTETMIVE